MVRRAILPMIRAQGSGTAPNRTVIDAALAEVPGQLATLDAAYAATGTGYLVGDAPTHADLFLAPILATLEMLPEAKAMMSDRPAVQRGIATIRARPSFAIAHAPAA
jgi:glutathione S-transferase